MRKIITFLATPAGIFSCAALMEDHPYWAIFFFISVYLLLILTIYIENQDTVIMFGVDINDKPDTAVSVYHLWGKQLESDILTADDYSYLERRMKSKVYNPFRYQTPDIYIGKTQPCRKPDKEDPLYDRHL